MPTMAHIACPDFRPPLIHGFKISENKNLLFSLFNKYKFQKHFSDIGESRE